MSGGCASGPSGDLRDWLVFGGLKYKKTYFYEICTVWDRLTGGGWLGSWFRNPYSISLVNFFVFAWAVSAI